MTNIVDQLSKTGGLGESGKGVSKTRSGKVGIITWQLPAVRKQLQMMSIEYEKSQQDLFAEALNMLFAHYKKPTIAA